MNHSTMWTGSYEFKSEIKELLEAFRNEVEAILKKIEETDKAIG